MNEVQAPKEIVTVTLPESVDSTTACVVEKLMMGKLHAGARLIVDGSAVAYMGAAGVRALATALHRADEVQAHVVFCRFSGPAADCLTVSGFYDLLDIADSVEAAVARLRPNFAAVPADRLHRRDTAG
jgi:anti-sigma B factor antagonist